MLRPPPDPPPCTNQLIRAINRPAGLYINIVPMIHSQSAACAALRRWIIMKIWFIPGLVKMWFRPPPLAQSSSRRPSREQDFYCHFDLREEGSEKNYDNIYSGRAGLTDLSPFRYRRLCLSRSSPCRFIPAVSPFQINPVRTWLTDISSFQPRGIELWQLWMPIVHQKWDRGPSENKDTVGFIVKTFECNSSPQS